MTTALTSAFPTIVDLAKKSDPNSGIAAMVELLAKKNSFLEDLAFKAGNLPGGHKFSKRVALPSTFWRKMNQGIAASKSQADTIEETCGMLEGLSKVDVALAELNGNAAAFRADEDNAYFASFGLEVARALFYESTATNPERIEGLTPRFDGTGEAAAQLVRAEPQGSVAANAVNSIWLVTWSPDTVYGIYPKNSVAGFKSEDLGKQIVKDSGGTNEFVAYVTHHKWQVGLAVQDYRQVARMCNIDLTRLVKDAATGPDLVLKLQDMIASIFSIDSGQPVLYMNRAVFAGFNKQLLNRSVNFLEYIERGGRRVPHFLGIPIRISDALTSVEAAI